MKLFVELGVDPHQKDKINQTSLYYAAREQKFNCCKFLVENNVSLNEKDFYQQTPIFYAAREGATRIIELFINHGADINLDDKYGQTCIFYSAKAGHEEATELLLKSGADSNKVDKKKLNLYMFSIKNNRPNIAELLLRYGANLNSNDIIKNFKKKQTKEDTVLEESHLKKYVLVKFTDDGKTRLTNEEFDKFKNDYGNIINLLNSKSDLELIENDADKRLKDTEGWEKVGKKVLNLLWKMKDAAIFHRPVDPIELNIPDYFTIIKNPMDLSTIKKKLYGGLYINFNEFDDDIKQIFYNCIIYNGVSFICKL
jgi:hypothetical protein